MPLRHSAIMGKSIVYKGIPACLGAMLFIASHVCAQVVPPNDTTSTGRGNKIIIPSDSNQVVTPGVSLDSTATVTTKKVKEKPDFRYHSPKKATWMSAALPSLGQFYNRRYWKPPIIYAGMGVAIYFLIDNQMKFIVARNSYRARLNVPGYTVDTKYESLSSTQILADRDFYRNNRDYSIIAVGGVYLLNIIDAAVDAHLRTFDVSDDLSMKVRPSFQYTSVAMQQGFAPMPGISWSIRF